MTPPVRRDDDDERGSAEERREYDYRRDAQNLRELQEAYEELRGMMEFDDDKQH